MCFSLLELKEYAIKGLSIQMLFNSSSTSLLLLLLLFLLVEISETSSLKLKISLQNGTDICEYLTGLYESTGIKHSDSHKITQTLFRWCTEDDRCSQFFNPSQGRANVTVFTFLSKPTIQENHSNLYWPLLELLCTQDATLESISKRLWISTLMANRDNLLPLCDVNHKLVIDSDTLSVSCVCMENRACSDSMFELTLFYLILAVLGLMVICYLIFNMYKMAEEIKFMKKITPPAGKHTDVSISVLRSIFER